jgi:hypothetical protein
MEPDLELDAWRRQWRSTGGTVPDLTQRVERETRAMRRLLGGEILVTLVFGGGSAAWAALSRQIDVLVFAVGVWAFIAITWTVSWLLRRGAWAPAAATTTAFLELSILRCRRGRESIVAQGVLYVLILAFDLTWIYDVHARRGPLTPGAFLTSPGVAWVWVLTAALAVVAVRRRQTLGRELANLTSLRQHIEHQPIQGGEVTSWPLPSRSERRSRKTKRRDGASAGS